MTTTTRKIETYEELERISRTGKNQKGAFAVKCLGLTMGRYLTLNIAIGMAQKLERQVEAPVTIEAA
jgi:hypothetical protein